MTQENLKNKILDYIYFLSQKMSCKDITAAPKTSKTMYTNDASGKGSKIALEYPMREYGELPRGQSTKRKFNEAYMVQFQFTAPVQAGEYIAKRIYADNDILRFMVLGHTRSFKHVGEDNELHL